MKKFTYLLTVLILISGIAFKTTSFAAKHVVTVGNFFFSPATVNVTVGDTIRWVWSAGNHTTTSTPGAIPAGAASWDHLINNANTFFEYKVTTAGSYAYVCTPHAPGMAGSIVAAAFTPTLSVAPPNRAVTPAAGTTTFAVTSNTSWTSSSNAAWCSVTAGGTGNGTINANYSTNTVVSQRVASVTIMVSGLPDQIVTVTQAAAASILTVGPANQNVPSASGSTAFNVTSNSDWIVSSDAIWCTVDPSGTGNGTITANFSANDAYLIRVATLTIEVAGLAPQTVTVTQAASIVGVDQHQSMSDLQVYPNPTRGIFKVDAGSLKEKALNISILDISGKEILSRICSGAGLYNFDISMEPKGYYFIRINSESASQVRRIVLID